MLSYAYYKLDTLYSKTSWLSTEQTRLNNFYNELSTAYTNLVQNSSSDLPQALRRLVLADVLDYAKSTNLQDQDCIDYYETYSSCIYLAIILILTTTIDKIFNKKPISITMNTLTSVQVTFSYNQATKTIRLLPHLLVLYNLRIQTLEELLATGSLSSLVQASFMGNNNSCRQCIECVTIDHQVHSLPAKAYGSFKDIAFGFKELNEEFGNNLLSAITVTG